MISTIISSIYLFIYLFLFFKCIFLFFNDQHDICSYYYYYYYYYYYCYYCYYFIIIMLSILLLLVYITRSSGRAQESWQNSDYQTFIYGQYNRVQGRNLKTFLKLLSPITGHLIFLFVYLFIYLFIYLFFSVNKFLLI